MKNKEEIISIGLVMKIPQYTLTSYDFQRRINNDHGIISMMVVTKMP